MEIILKLICPCCGKSLHQDLYGYCCLNEDCNVAGTEPDKRWIIAATGITHREDGPAIELASGDKHWFFNGLRHRENGPAIEYSDGEREYWIHGIKK